MYKLDLDAIQREIDSAGHGRKAAIIRQYTGQYGISRETLYRQLRQRFGKKKTLVRAKKVEQALIDQVGEMKELGIMMGLGDRELATENCIRLLSDQGVAGADRLTVSTVNRRLREAGYRIPNAKVRVEASYANQEFQLDFSRSKYFQIYRYDSVRQDFLMRVSGRELHYKKDDRRLRTWLVQVKDSYSRCRIIKAYGATSENGFIGLDTLDFMFNRPEDDNPMRFVPEMIKTDQGAFHKRKEVKALAELLGIQLRNSAPYNHDSQGKIESGFFGLWNRFELAQAVKMGDGYELYLSEYNELLHEFSISDAQLKCPHPIVNDTREGASRTSILKHPPRQVDEEVLRIACRVDTRDVPETLMIQYPGGPYHAPEYAAGKQVRIYKNMLGELMAELVEEDRRTFILKSYEYREIDNFEHRSHTSYKQTLTAQAEKNLADKRAENKRLFMKPRASKIEVESPFLPQAQTEFANEYDARVYIGKQLTTIGKTYADFSYVFDELLADDLTKESIDTVISEIKRTATMRIAL